MAKKQYACGTYRLEPKYHDKKRKSPPYSATDCEGRVMVGNDGNDWIAELSGKSVRWVKLESSKSVRKALARKSRRKSKRKSAVLKSRRKSQRKSKPRGGNKKKAPKKK
jgi:hypothetical protein